MAFTFVTYCMVLGSLHQAFSEPTTSAKVEKLNTTTLEGVDISNWQAGISIAKLPGDFVIVKITGGTKYVSPSGPTQINTALNTGKCVGVYHFALRSGSNVPSFNSSNRSVEEEARWFLKNTKDYRGEVVPILDWEGENASNTTWALTWLEIVEKEWGVKPWIYMSLNMEKSHDWTNIVNAGYKLWLAQWSKGGKAGGHSPTKFWPSPLLWQWTSKGTIPEWSGHVDMDIFYGNREAWNKYKRIS